MKQQLLRVALMCAAICGVVACSSKDDGGTTKYYKVGDLYSEGTVRGVVYTVDATGTHGLIVSMDQAKKTWAANGWESKFVGASSDIDGAANMAVMRAVEGWQTAFPAFAWCESKNVGGDSGWVFPSFDQLTVLYINFTKNKELINKTLIDNGGVQFSSDTAGESDYWCSTEATDVASFGVAREFDTGKDDFPLKTEESKVRAIRAF